MENNLNSPISNTDKSDDILQENSTKNDNSITSNANPTKKRKFPSKSRIILLIIIFAIVSYLIVSLIASKTSDIVVITSSSGGFIGEGYSYTFKTNNFLKTKYTISDDNYIQQYNKEFDNYWKTVHKVDKKITEGKYIETRFTVCKINNYIYYFRTNDFDHFYKLNTSNNKITQLKVSDYSTKKATHEDEYQFDVVLYLMALYDQYPACKNIIPQSSKYNTTSIFYFNNKIYFEKYVPMEDSIIYEYDIEKNKKVKLCKIRDSHTLQYIGLLKK